MFERSIDGLPSLETVGRLDSDAVLHAAAGIQAALQRAEMLLVAIAARWAELNDDVEPNDLGIPGFGRLAQLGGEGTPAIDEFAPAELGAVLGRSDQAGRVLIAAALDLTYRLPALWALVKADEVSAWKGRQVAEQTRDLPADVVAKIDTDIAGVAGTLSMRHLNRLVRATVIEYDHATVATQAEQAVAERGVWISEPADDGNTDIFIRTDHASALAFGRAVDQVAHSRCDGESTIQERRAAAVGLLTVPGADVSTKATLYVHVNATTLSGDTHVARVEGVGPVLADQVRGWLRRADLTVRPVIDLHQQVPVDAWETPLRMREQVRLRTPVDAFPFASCDGRGMDLDHTIPYDPHGPPGQTSPANLAPLTRRHHRIKTFGGWDVRQPFDGVLVWRSPNGRHFLVDHTGTQTALDSSRVRERSGGDV